MHLLYFRPVGPDADLSAEYIVLTEDDAVDSEEHCRPGHELFARANIDLTFETGHASMLPTDTELFPC